MSCGSNASEKVRVAGGRARLGVDVDGVEALNAVVIEWKDGCEGRVPSVAGSMMEFVDEFRSSSGVCHPLPRGSVGDEMVEGTSMYIVKARGGGETSVERSCGASRSWAEGL